MSMGEKALAHSTHSNTYAALKHGVVDPAEALRCLVAVMAAVVNTEFPAEEREETVTELQRDIKSAVAGFAIYAAGRRNPQ
jgi:hydrogenase/urease accessory protein HupE